ncbi:MAG: flagellar hook-basal body protein [Planctomycetota bacterium]
MDQSSLSLAASMQALSTRLAGISHNLANVSSTAFKRRTSSFDEALARTLEGGFTIVPVYHEQSDFQQGDLLTTNNQLNVGLLGEGYFSVRRPGDLSEVFYTRNGEFAVNRNGVLVTRGGFEVLGPGGSTVNVGGATGVKISTTGEITDQHSGDILGNIALWRFADQESLSPAGSGLWKLHPSAGQPDRDRITIIEQGSLERSNVNALTELVSMISVQRHFQGVARALSTIDAMNNQMNQLALS